MKYLGTSADIASVFGLVVALFTLYNVNKLPNELKRHSRLKLINDLIEKLTKLPKAKSILTVSSAKEVESVVHMIRTFDLPRVASSRSRLLLTIESLEIEIQGNKHRDVVLTKLAILKSEIGIR